jgi:3-methyl-2-oxobutanoate hydroxymethyltransferase
MVIEGVPDAVGTAVTAAVDVPTIGIGAGSGCDGQVLVFHDVLGLGTRRAPKFVRRYANLAEDATKALAEFAADVRGGAFPGAAESYESSDELRDALGPKGSPKT